MNELIKIEKNSVGGDLIETVNARELHQFLGVGKMFANWIKDRIEQYNFIENLDYMVFSETGNNPSGGLPSEEYAISIDMAKELAMAERNEKGRQARQYFILEMLRTYCEHHAPRILPALPAYAIDKPSDSTADSSQPTVPISVIVDGITSAAKANKALHAAGLLKQRFLETSNGGQKAFWELTAEGMKYGRNHLVSPSNSRETQPRWYDCKSDEIVKIIIDNLGKVQQ